MSMISSILSLLQTEGFIPTSKALVHAIGRNEAMIFCELVSRHVYFANDERLTEDGYFFNTVYDLQSATGLTDKQQRKALDKLEEIGLIKRGLRGSPPKRFFKIVDDETKVVELIQDGNTQMRELKPNIPEKNQNQLNGKFKSEHMSDSNLSKGKTNNTNYNNTKDNNKDHMAAYSSEKLKGESEGLVRGYQAPTKEKTKSKEETKTESKEEGTSSKAATKIPFKEIVDYLNEAADKKFNHAANNNKKLIRARWNEGYSLDDFKKVIDNKAAEWKNDKEMDQYLRPATLFSDKFDGYLNQRPKKRSSLGVTR